MKSLFAVLFVLMASAGYGQIQGCTDPAASNFNPAASQDNGSCCYDNWVTFQSSAPISWSLTESVAVGSFITAFGSSNSTMSACIPSTCFTVMVYPLDGQTTYFDVTLTDQAGNVLFAGSSVDGYLWDQFTFNGEVIGCMNYYACNFDPLATCGNQAMCDFTSCGGCTDPAALNFDPAASFDNGTCCYGPGYSISGNTAFSWFVYDAVSFATIAIGNYPEDAQFCDPSGCFVFEAHALELTSPFSIDLTDPDGAVTPLESNEMEFFYVVVANGSGLTGCPDPAACNYDPNASCADPTSCTYDCYGCTNPVASNFDPEATIDDGSCCTESLQISVSESAFISITSFNGFNTSLEVESSASVCIPEGCLAIYMYSSSGLEVSYNFTLSDGSLIEGVTEGGYVYFSGFGLNTVPGCTDPGACNFDPEANCFDQSCDYQSCQGCTDPEATNFDPAATVENGSCCYGNFYTVQMTGNGYWDLSGGGVFEFGYSNEVGGFCAVDGCYQIFASSFGIEDFTISVFDEQGELVIELPSLPGGVAYGNFAVGNVITGCTDPMGCNYNPEANCQDVGSCDYSCYGCTDPAASNFNPEATADNGTCCFSDWYTISATGQLWWSAQSDDYYFGSFGSYPANEGFCMDGNCFSIYLYSSSPEPVDVTVTGPDGNIFWTGVVEPFGMTYEFFSGSEIIGCTDPTACNFNPEASCSDWMSCDFGCTDSSAPNFDPAATLDDGSCCLNDWYTLSFSEPTYWQIMSAQGYIYGMYPENNGFCTIGSCGLLVAYSLSGNPVDYSVTAEDGTLIASGTSIGWYQNIDVSFDANEIAGCTDPVACNYNESATCDNGSCLFYCGGCTDEEAINYDPYASFDDGSCVFEAVDPEVQMMMIPDEDNEQFYVAIGVINEGNMAPYVLVDNQGTPLSMISEQGQYMVGPFPCDEEKSFSLNSLPMGMQELMGSGPFLMECSSVVSVEDVPAVLSAVIYPNPTDGRMTLSGLPDGFTRLSILDLTGRQVWADERTLSGGVFQLDVASLPAGHYIMWAQGAESVRLPFIIAR